MLNEYEIALSTSVERDLETIRAEIIFFSNADDANVWEDGLFDVIRSLKHVAGFQECKIESRRAGFSIRKILYRQSGIKRQYHLFFTIEEYTKPIVEPTTPYLVGMVKILAVRQASRRSLTGKELQERLRNV